MFIYARPFFTIFTFSHGHSKIVSRHGFLLHTLSYQSQKVLFPFMCKVVDENGAINEFILVDFNCIRKVRMCPRTELTRFTEHINTK